MQLPGVDVVAQAVADAHRHEWGYVLAATVRVTRDIDIAEECVQDAFVRALVSWRADGIPHRPGAWLTAVARNRALDVLRHERVVARKLPLLVVDDDVSSDMGRVIPPRTGPLGDDLLRLMFTCCHPALSAQAKQALTLRLVCGVPTGDVARAFLVTEPTMAARLTRAKRKIATARIPYRVPSAAELPARVGAVLTVVHLLFTTGHTAPSGDALQHRELAERAVDLGRLLRALMPHDGEVAGLLALLVLTDSRRATRQDNAGRLVLLADQDRSRWDHAQISEGIELVRWALSQRPAGRFALQAAIAAVHAEAPSWEATDWRELVGLYDVLGRVWPSPVVALNRAVALGMADGPEAGLAALAPLAQEAALATYPYLASARAAFLRRAGRAEESAAAYAEALAFTENAVERAFLTARLAELTDPGQ